MAAPQFEDAASQPEDAGPQPKGAALRFQGVDLDRVGVKVLHALDWSVAADERWVLLGPNGSGKTTMMQLASGYLQPTRGRVDILGETLGRVDVRTLRRRLGIVSAAVGKMVVGSLTGLDVVMAARDGALEPWWASYSTDDRARAAGLLDAAGFGYVADRQFSVLSEGERQQVLLARSLMGHAELLLLDEPCAGLDIAGRERLVSRLAAVARDHSTPPTVLVTHHVEEIPESFTHVLLLREGSIIAAGPIAETLSADALSDCYDMKLELTRHGGRWTCAGR